MATRKKSSSRKGVNPNPKATTLEKPETAAEARKRRAAEVKERNRLRLEKLNKQKAEKKAARGAAKAKQPDPDKLARAAAQKAERDAKEQKAAEAAKALTPIAKEVNHRLAEAQKMDGKADDHRLAAALQLKLAEEQCRAAGINFKKWSEAEVKGQSYETVRKLLAVGKADEPMLALADMRAKNAAANKRLRERQKAEREQRQSGRDFETNADDIGRDIPFAKEGPAVVRNRAEQVLEGLAALKAAFEELKASEQMEFAEWVAQEVGARLESDL